MYLPIVSLKKHYYINKLYSYQKNEYLHKIWSLRILKIKSFYYFLINMNDNIEFNYFSHA